MARFNASEIENYGTQSNRGGFFSLSKDKETAKVRFMYEKAEDIEGYAVHKVRVGDKERYVNCLREYNEPVDKCPFCQAKLAVQAKMFIPVYNEDADQIQIWERGKTFYGKISGLSARYPNLVATEFEIERNGKPNDTKTTYEIYPMGAPDGTTIQDILDDLQMDELPSPLGTIILDKSAEEMEAYLNDGEFPSDDVPTRRHGRAQAEEPPFDTDEPAPRRGGRRTPARGSDRF